MITLPALSPRLIAAGVALFIPIVLTALLAFARADLKAAVAERDAARTQLTAAHTQVTAARASARDWERIAGELQRDLNARIERERVEREAAERAVAEARQIAAEADATLAFWLDRYAEATRDVECAALLSRPICPVGAPP